MFAQSSSQGDRLELAIADLALAAAKGQAARNFAREIKRQHSAALAQKQQLARRLRVFLPPGLSAAGETIFRGLSSLPRHTDAFDAHFAVTNIFLHEDAIEFARAEVEMGENDEVRRLARSSLDFLQRHLVGARRLLKEVEGNNRKPGGNGGNDFVVTTRGDGRRGG